MNPNFKKELKAVGLDVDRAIRDYYIGNEDMFERIVMSILNEPDFIKETLDAIEKNDAKVGFNATHVLKSELGYFCFDKVNNNVKLACEIFRKGICEGAKELIEEVKDDYYEFINILKKYTK